LNVLDIPGGPAGGLAVTNAGLVVAGGADRTIRVWNPDGQLLYALPGNMSGFGALVLARDGSLITAGRNGELTRWPPPVPLPDLIADARRCTLPSLTPAIRHRWMLSDAPDRKGSTPNQYYPATRRPLSWPSTSGTGTVVSDNTLGAE
jgi:WD40 repeat protein